ncbi:MAG: cyclic nucleotide-binding domain-containing protein [Desulfobacteraceae bacterium]|nr:cyclic nucleotide-binding domain-containing protein [Desulfobacteraceae bacterium]
MVEKSSCSIEQLEVFPRLRIFSHVQISYLSKIFEIHKYRKGECVYKEEDPSDFLAVILSGMVLLQKGEQNLHKTKKGSCYGQRHIFGYDIFSEYPRNLTVKAIESTKLLVLPKKKLIDFDHNHPITAMNFYKLLLSYNSLQLRYISEMLEER